MREMKIDVELTPRPNNKTNRAITFIIAYKHLHKHEPTTAEVKEGIGGAGNSIIYTAFHEANHKGELKITKAQQKHIDEVLLLYRQQMNTQVIQEAARMRETAFPRWKEEAERAHRLQQSLERAVDGYKPVFADDEYENILRCLHPDSRNSVSEERLKLAFQTFVARKVRLLTPKKANGD